MIVMSILMEFDPTGKDNDHFQRAINEWQKTYDKHYANCVNHTKKVFSNNVYNNPNYHNSTIAKNMANTSCNKGTNWENNNFSQSIHEPYSGKGKTSTEPASWRGLSQDKSQIWDPFHESLERVS